MDKCPFSGKPCSNVKNIHVKQTINGQLSEFNCCQQCATGFMPVSIVLPGFSLIPVHLLMPNAPQNMLLLNLQKLNAMERETCGEKCPECNCTIDEIVSMGKMGCPNCYTTHREKVAMNLPQMHAGGRTHKGKTPKFNNVNRLKEQMAKAVEEERYEDAAVFRDRIKELEQTLKGDNVKSPEQGVKEDLI